jgi:PAS domain S-box-containing protein
MALLDREKRLKFIRLSEHERQLLRGLRPLFEQHAGSVVEAFFERLGELPEAGQLLRDRETMGQLKQQQHNYLVSIAEAKFDDDYVAERRRIGQTHERVGLAPRWYLLASSIAFELLTPLVRKFLAADPARADQTMVALQKVFMLDASLAMEAYIASDRYRHLQQLESIVNDSADVIFLLDTEKRFRAWNRSAEKIFGWRAEEVLGKPLSLITPPELVEAGEQARIDQAVQKHGHCNLETVRLAKDGRRVPVEVTVSLLRDPQGHPIGRSAILRDITERKRVEEIKLQSERLAVIGAMSAKLAHEIRNPLSSVSLNIDLVKDEIEALARSSGQTAEEARGLMHSIDSEVRRIERVTEDYLKFARLPTPHRELVDLNDVISNGLAFLQSLFHSTGVKVETDLDRALPQLRADESQLWQAILNLIRNALEAMPNGGSLILGTARQDKEIVLVLRDTGHGIKPQDREHIFRPFFSTKTGGTGLGLPLTQQIIAEHGGRIECDSAEGRGTTFTIRLPVATES